MNCVFDEELGDYIVSAGPMPWRVIGMKAREDYVLELVFEDGTSGEYDARPLLQKSAFSKLTSLPHFLSAHVECGTVVWNEELDIAPEHLYEHCVRQHDDKQSPFCHTDERPQRGREASNPGIRPHPA